MEIKHLDTIIMKKDVELFGRPVKKKDELLITIEEAYDVAYGKRLTSTRYKIIDKAGLLRFPKCDESVLKAELDLISKDFNIKSYSHKGVENGSGS
jgi:hypothetical protein